MVPSGNDTASEMQLMASHGVGAVRLLVNWNLVEPRQGVRDFSYYDAYVAQSAAAGLQIQPLLLGEPAWTPHYPRPPIFSPTARAAWQSFVAEFAGRYGPNGLFWRKHPTLPYLPMTTWEPNQPNLRGYLGGRPSPRQYVRFLRVDAHRPAPLRP